MPSPGPVFGQGNAPPPGQSAVSITAPAVAANRAADLLPGLTAAVSFSVADILLKITLSDGMDALSLAALRGVLVVAVFICGSVSARRPATTPRARG